MQNKFTPEPYRGILLVNKPKGKTSFSLVSALRKISHVEKIGHAGTLDPFATGVMVMLIGKSFTKLSDSFIQDNKEYQTTVKLGTTTDSFDIDGNVTSISEKIPTLAEVEQALSNFQGCIDQIPPMFSAKKVDGQKLYKLARQGKTIDLKPVKVTLTTELLSYSYPYLELYIRCSKGTYVRAIARDLGTLLGCGAHLSELTRTRSGKFHINDCLPFEDLFKEDFDLTQVLKPAPT